MCLHPGITASQCGLVGYESRIHTAWSFFPMVRYLSHRIPSPAECNTNHCYKIFLLTESQFPPSQADPFIPMPRLNIEVPLKSTRWPVLTPFAATVPFTGWSTRISRGLYILPYIVVQSVPRILRRTNKGEPPIRRGLQIFKQSLQESACVFHFRLRIVLILNFSAIRLFS
jgi:hypothetical protein